jgi:hypothetical protein
MRPTDTRKVRDACGESIDAYSEEVYWDAGVVNFQHGSAV